jgi:hypothetical protein
MASAREEMARILQGLGHDVIALEAHATRYGAVETPAEGAIYARFLKEHEGEEITIKLSGWKRQATTATSSASSGTTTKSKTSPDLSSKTSTQTTINPSPSAAVGAGNETWQRIAETVISAFAKADPEIAKAPSHGCMNNIVFGGIDPRNGRVYTYYETIGGGEGARRQEDQLQVERLGHLSAALLGSADPHCLL